ncbi:MAG: tetratricopeptide repeat protein [Cyclobacteriaceae bacterium]|nr:tetratricopeptide repeat protein [Cyclobacteriaceae bacterium]
MASILPNYQYDIFVSYRHNDNLDSWVTEFVGNLEKELRRTIKEPVSIYFDSNPHDGLLETHNVDKSLEGKLKCLILMPILSNTYCDINSFAWRQEFCPFNQWVREDQYGLDIQLLNGNVTSRILPVKIHDLEPEDQNLIEEEIGSILRSVDFIYKEPGINRPLKIGDNRNDNQNHTDFRNQINKLSHAIKDIIYSITKPHRIVQNSSQKDSKIDFKVQKQSIAVLPFSNLSFDNNQEYFSDGITENIIIELAGNSSLKTISRTSVMRYKKSDKTAPEIASELNVRYILEGGVQVQGNRMRINVQLIDAGEDELKWAKVFTEGIDDIFEVQSKVASLIMKELNISLGSQTREEPISRNSKAVELYLKGRHAFNLWGLEGYKNATEYFKKALELDPDFKQAYSALASSYSARMSWNGDLSPQEAEKEINLYLEESWKRGPSANDYLTKGFMEFFIRKDFTKAEDFFLKAHEMAPGDAGILYAYCYLLNMSGRLKEAAELLDKAGELDPLTPAYFNYRSLCYYLSGKYSEALETLEEGLKLYPGVLRFYDFKTRNLLAMNNWKMAEEVIKSGLEISTFHPPSMVAFLAIACFAQEKKEGNYFLDQLIQRSRKGEKGVNFNIVYVYSFLKDYQNAQKWLKKAKKSNDVALIWYENDPLLEDTRKTLSLEGLPESTPDFKGAEKEIIEYLEKGMPALPYHNLNHIWSVVEAARKIGEAEGVSEEEHKIVRLAALYHDSGFSISTKDHEHHGTEIAREKLPKHNFPDETIEDLCSMIMATRLPQSPKNHLESILCDADLDYLGTDDFHPIGDLLYEEVLQAGMVETRREWNFVQKTFLESHRYHTRFGKENREANKQEWLNEVREGLKRNK